MNAKRDYYRKPGGGYYGVFIRNNIEFDCDEFEEFVIGRNRADCDSGELHNVAAHEVLRLAAEWTEKKWRFENIYGEATK